MTGPESAISQPCPVSPAQERLWFLDRTHPGTAICGEPHEIRLRGSLEEAALAAALGEIVNRHEVLRTVFREHHGEPVPIVQPWAGVPLPRVDLSGLPETARETAARVARRAAVRPFDLRQGPLLRALLLRLNAAEHVLLLQVHPIATDAWSSDVLDRELAALYRRFAGGGPPLPSPPLPPLPLQYADFAAWQRRWLAGPEAAAQLAAWSQRLAGLPAVLELPADRPRPAVPSFRGTVERMEVTPVLEAPLAALGHRAGATLFMTLLAAFQTLLHRIAGRDDVAVGAPAANRNRPELQGLIGPFANSLVLRADLAGDPSFVTVLGRVREAALFAYAHQELPFERLVAELAPETDVAHAPIFQLLVSLAETPPQPLDLGADLRGEVQEVHGGSARLDLSLRLSRHAEGLTASLEYASGLFDQATAVRLLALLRALLEGIAATPEARLSELPLLSPAEREQVLCQWNRTASPLPDLPPYRLFEAHARRAPEALAVSWSGGSITYGELDRRASRLAGRLRRLGVGPESVVAVLLERSPELVLAVLATAKAGGAWLPIDPAYPAERIATMLCGSGAVALLTAVSEIPSGIPPLPPERVLRLNSRAPEEAPGDEGEGPEAADPHPDQLAYVIYTSGSTGTPKGTEVRHRGLANLVAWYLRTYALGPADRSALVAGPSFDASVFEMWPALAAGASLCVPPAQTVLSPPALLAWLAENEVTVAFLPTPLAEAVLAEPALRGPTRGQTPELALRLLMTGGDRLVRRPPPGLPFALANHYGPAENTVVTTAGIVAATSGTSDRLPDLGIAIDNTRVYLLDRALRPVPLGVQGELCAAGEGLARGYRGRPDLTAERFVPNPVDGLAGARLYRTGDLARRLPDGSLEFLGRIDRQVKIRGVRIELGEIENALAAQPEVAAAAVLVREDAPGSRRLAGYVVAPEISSDELRARLARLLPAAMIPSVWVFLDALPLTPNGKVDRAALARIPPPEPEIAARTEAPRTPGEQLLADLFREVLMLDREVGSHDDFFQLGGHSLLVFQLAARMRAVLGVDVDLRTVFEHPTVAGLDEWIADAIGGGRAATVTIVPVARGAESPLSYAQQRLWFLDRFEGGTSLYNVPVAFRLAGSGLRVSPLAGALDEIVRRHEALRTVFRESAGGEPVQVVQPFVAGAAALPVIDLSGLPDARSAAGPLERELADRPFDLVRGPLLRCCLLRLGAEEHHLVVSMHHIASDGWSLEVLVREISELYQAFARGLPSPLPPLPIQYADFAIWQRLWLAGETLEAELAWWRERLAGLPPALELPADRPRPARQSFRGDLRGSRVEPRVGAGLAALSRRHGATLFMTLAAAFYSLLSRYTGEEDLAIGTAIAGRNRAETEGLIGFFVNTLVLRTSLAGDPTFLELLARARTTALDAYAHQDLPFEQLVAELAPQRDLARTPLFQVMFALWETAPDLYLSPGLTGSIAELQTSTAKFDLFLQVSRDGDELRPTAEYATDLFDAATLDRLLGHLGTLLAGIAAAPETRISELPLLTGAELEQLRSYESCGKPVPLPAPALLGLLEAHVRRAPETLAVSWSGGSMTYGELDRRANALAHHLRGLGVRPDIVVAILLERSAESVIAVVATVKAGGAWLPIDPVNPGERVATMLRDSGAAVLLTGAAQLARVPDLPLPPERVLRLDGDDFPDESTAPPAPFTIDPDHLAYVIYTSGSTGVPKGAALTWRGLTNLVNWDLRTFERGPEDRAPLLAGPGFDASVWEIWPTLAAGASLHVPLKETILSPSVLLAWLAAERITLTFIATPVAVALLEEMQAAPLPPELALRTLLTGGDRLVRRWPELAFTLINMYGPTETTVYATGGIVTPTGTRAPHIGTALDNTRIHLLDRHLRPVPVGLPGELYIAGAGLARGYLGRPELTAERFVPNPLAPPEDEPGQRMYRTGDLARWLPSGEIEFLGRIDHQVKIRGIRIELGEIESVLAAQPEVAAAVVEVREDATGDRRLVAYVVAPGGPGVVSSGELRERLARRLPAAMVPAAWVFLDALPLTPNGKLDRRALERIATPEPEADTSTDGSIDAPQTPIEQLLADLVREILKLPRPVSSHDDFFHLGGHSLLVVQLASQAAAVFGVNVDIRTVFDHPTVAGLAEWIADAIRGGRPAMAPIVPVARGAESPLSFAQQRLWFLDRLESSGTSLYNVPLAFHLTGSGLRVSPLADALDEIVRRHEALRTVFRESADGEPMQVVLPFVAGAAALPAIDLSGLPDTRAARAEAELVERELADQPFDLVHGPLLRCCLLRLGAEEHHLVVSMHHIASDGWSLEVLVREISELYQAFAQGLPSPLPPLPVQYADFAIWQRRWLAGEIVEAELAWWRERLAGLPPALELPADRPRPARPSFRGSLRHSHVEPRVGAGLAALSRRHGATLFMTLTAAFYTLLCRYTGEEDLVLGTPIAGRNRAEIEGLIGFFVNTLVLRASLAGDVSFLELLARVRMTALDAYAHQDLPFEQLVAELASQRDLSRTPLFQVLFAVWERAPDLYLGPGLTGSMAALQTSTAKFDLALQVSRSGDELRSTAEYATDLFDAATLDRLLAHLSTLLAGIAAAPETRLSELPLLAAGEREQLAAWNATREPRPAGATLHGLFAAQAARTPDAVAVIAEEGTLTYRELDARSDRLARRLVALGAGIDSRVGLFLERSLEMVVALLGVLKAGAAYVPIDPDYPAERVAAMLEDAQPVAVLTQERLAGRLPAGARTLFLDGDWDREAGGDLPPTVPEEAAAYLIFTSGSTGRPKATVVPHRAIVNYMLWMQAEFPLGPADRVLQKTAISFDASVWEFWAPLLAGSTLVMARPGEHREPAALINRVREHGITVLPTVPSLLRALLEDGRLGECRSLRRVFCGGEALGGDLQTAFFTVQEAELINLYGPTETTVAVTFWRCEREQASRPALLGEPIPNARLHVLGARLEPCPVGVPGELFVGGVPVSRGYLGRAVETASRFLPDPFAAAPGERLYRTGDLERRRPDGLLEYLGRADHQVKIRGFRIELGEVEAAIAAHPAVGQAVVLALPDSAGGSRLVAYVTGEVEEAGLRAFLKERLPEHMVPTGWVFLDALPLTPNEKLDRRALSRLEPAAEPGGAFQAPRTPLEETLAKIFASLLGLAAVGVDDDFFGLGGHSLLAMRAIAEIRRTLGVELPVRTLFESSTVSRLSLAVEAAESAPAALSHSVAPRPSSRLPLSFAQQRLWFLDQLTPGSHAYNIPFPLRLEGALEPPALAAALSEIARRHQVLRTTYAMAEGEPYQIVHPAGLLPLPLVDLTPLPGETGSREALRLAAEDALRPFDLAAGPVLRVSLVRRSPAEHVLLCSVHHIAFDGWSAGLFLTELAALYDAFATGGESPLPELPWQYADFAVWQRSWLTGEIYARQLAFWRRALENAPEVLELPTDHPRPPAQSLRGEVLRSPLPAAMTPVLRALARERSQTLFVLMLAGFQALLQRYTGQDDLLVSTPVAGRHQAEVEGLIGFFVNTLALRGDLAGDPSFDELLARTRETCLAAFACQDLPFEVLVEELHPERDMSRSPLVQVMLMLMLQNAQRQSPHPAGLRLVPIEADLPVSKLDLTLGVMEESDGLLLSFEYATDLFEAATIERLAGHFQTLLASAVAEPGRRLSELPLLAAGEREQLAAWNATGEPRPAGATLHGLFAAQAARTPDAVAVIAEEGTLTYRELDARSDRLARRLVALGAGIDSRVGLFLERSLEMVVALLGVLKAGAAYVPIDPDYPAERVAAMLEDAQPVAVLTQEQLADGDRDRDWNLDQRGDLPATVPEEAAAYLIFTSGSTGRPKATVVPHRAIVNHMLWMQAEFPLGPADRVLQKTAFSFDASVWEFWAPLLAGSTLVMARPGEHREPAALINRIRKHGVTVLQTVPSLLRALLEDGRFGECRSLRRVFCGGEALGADVQTAFFATFFAAMEAELINLYGPTETTVEVTFWRCERERASRPALLGGPIPNARLHVLGARLEPCPVGVPGELFVGGVPVSRGYLGRAVETASRFLPDPFAAAPGERLYRTGDLVRRRPDGLLEYLGRADHQVKVRGFRIELGEVEAAIAAHPGVRAVAAMVREDQPREDQPGDRRLVAYVVADGAGAEVVTPQALRHAVQARLPEAMTPSLFILLDALPLTPNGKVDRRALSSPELRAAAPGPMALAGHEHVAPRTHLEERVADLWRTVLKVDRLGIHDSFWELGGHSLLATRLAYRVRESFGIELPVRTLFEHPTLAGYAAVVAESLERPGERAERMTPRTGSGPAPLSHAQQRLWFLDRLQPGLAVYNLPVQFGIAGPLAAGSLAAALSEIVRRHGVLRTTFAVDAESGDPVQVVAEPVRWLLPRVDLAGLPATLRAAEAERLLAAERRLPFNLARGPLLRSLLVRLSPQDHRLALTMHHIISDGWSIGVLRRELQALYGAAVMSRPSPMPELAVQYADFSVWQRRWLAGGEWEAQLAWWRQTLAGAPPTLDLPTDRPRPAVQSLRGDLTALPLGLELSAAVAQLGQRRRTTPFMTLLAAFEALLFRYTGQEDLWVGTPIANRRHAETEDLLGFFVNTLVLRLDLGGDPTFDELLGRVRETALAAYDHQDLPFEKLVEELAPARDLSRTPLFQVLFTADSERTAPTELVPGVTLEALAVDLGTAKFDLSLAVEPGPEGLEAVVEWATDLFDAATVRRLLAHFRSLLTAAAGNPATRISELPLLAAEEREEVVAFGRRAAAPILDTPVQQLFEAHARRAPEALAVSWSGGSMTYGELDRRANALAHHLRGLGVRPDSVVAILLERSAESVIAMVATVKAGGAWLPIDPANPGERIATMLRDSGAAVLLTGAAQLARVPDLPLPPERVLRLDGDGFPEESTAPPVPFAIDPDHLAYVIYTSGSTGMPKGTGLTYRGLANLVSWDLRTFGRGPQDRATLLAGPGFDASVWEVWPTLAAGASLHAPSKETLLSPPALLAWLAAERITLAFLATPLAEALLEEMQAAPLLPVLALRALLTGGDRVVRRPWPELTFTLINMYGPTESTVYATGGIVTPTGTRAPHIGTAIDNTRVYLVDRHLRRVPIGLPGELSIAGASLARGYLGRPELTAERFVPNPLDTPEDVPGQRMYRTGDLARWLPSGQIEFLGRIDHQVKIRGIRIELGEIESVLAAQPEVAAAAVMMREDATGDRRLVAYVVAPGGPGVVSAGELRERLARRLPAAMVPAAWVFLEALPLTSNGKVDRRALPAPEPMVAEHEFIAPRTPLEEQVAGIWRAVLKIDRVGADDNFWDLGGHSLIATKVLARVRDTFGIDLPLQSLFTTPGLAEFAAAVGQSVLAAQAEDAADLLSELDGLSEEEIRSLLAAEAGAVEELT